MRRTQSTLARPSSAISTITPVAGVRLFRAAARIAHHSLVLPAACASSAQFAASWRRGHPAGARARTARTGLSGSRHSGLPVARHSRRAARQESAPEFVQSVEHQTEAKLMVASGGAYAAQGLQVPILRLEELSNGRPLERALLCRRH